MDLIWTLMQEIKNLLLQSEVHAAFTMLSLLVNCITKMYPEENKTYVVPQADIILIAPKSVLMTSDENEPITPGPDY